MNYPDPLHRIINVIQGKYEVHVKNIKINVYMGCAYEKQLKINNFINNLSVDGKFLYSIEE